MATVQAAETRLGQGLYLVTWEGMADGDDGDPVLVSRASQLTAQATGDATSVAIEGSNDGTNYVELTSDGSTEIALAGATFDIAEVYEHPVYIKPVATGGSDTTVTLVLHATV